MIDLTADMTSDSRIQMQITRVYLLLPLFFLTAVSGQYSLAQNDRQLRVADVVKRSTAGVVQIVVSDQAGNELGLGSGFIVSANGEIVTNYHVIEGAHLAIAKLANGSFFPIKGVLAADADTDLVLLKVEGRELPLLNLGSIGKVQVGDHVVAIGSPLGLEGTVSDGIVSALRIEAAGKNWIQTTAPVSHGNSGGPLLNMSGEVVGVITWGVNLQEGANLNFAVPSDEVKSLLSTAAELSPLDSIRTKKQLSTARPTVETPATEQANAQQDEEERHAIEQLRAITEMIKNCPGSSYSPDWYGTQWASAPLNPVWEVIPGRSPGSGKTGAIQWVQHFTYIADGQKQCKKKDAVCERDNRIASSWDTEMSGVSHPDDFRLEFDIGVHGLEPSRRLWKHEMEDDSHWVAATYVLSCESDAVKMTITERPSQIPEEFWERAKKGDAEAMYRLGLLYKLGKGVSPDRSEALHWYQRAADMGNAKAEYLLGTIYFDGQGGGPPEYWYPLGLFWLRKSADQGDPDGLASLGGVYYAGQGVAVDPTEAYFWYSLAAMTSSTDPNIQLARKGKDEISTTLKGAKLRKVQERIGEWLDAHPKTQ